MNRILAIDQGTTSSRALIFDDDLQPSAVGQMEFTQHFPKSGWVEHDPEEIWSSTVESCKTALSSVEVEDVAAIGITNQRETVIVWDRETGKPVHNAIVWQDRRTSEACSDLRRQGLESMVSEKTGLLLDPYFSSTKIAWILSNIEGVRQAAEDGKLMFGTVDCYLIWRLTGGKSHVTDATNASRTMLFNIESGDWDDELLELFAIPRSMMPEVRDCASSFGTTDRALFGKALPIQGVAGDQQAATIGQACFRPGMLKSTYGTGCFALMNTGSARVRSSNRLLSTIAYRLAGETTYALEGSIFIAGAVVQWIRDKLGFVAQASEAATLAEKADPEQRVYIVPAFTGLGAPYWEADCRGAIYGLTRNSGRAEIAKAALQSVAFQTRDLYEAMSADALTTGNSVLRVDGGMAASDWTMQAIADQLNAPVDRPAVTETTALGAAYLAGYNSGICPSPDEFAAAWSLEKRFTPKIGEAERERDYAEWKHAVSRTIGDTS